MDKDEEVAEVAEVADNHSPPPPSSSSTEENQKCTYILVLLTVLVGSAISVAFIVMGVRSAFNDQALRFEKQATEFVDGMKHAWNDYKFAGSWIHQACGATSNTENNTNNSTSTNQSGGTLSFSSCSRKDFKGLYEYLSAGGLTFHHVAYAPNVTHNQRAELELEAAAYYEKTHPFMNYTGITGFEPDSETAEVSIKRRSDQPFYFPHHFMLPISENYFWIDLDLYSSARSDLIDSAVQSWTAVLSDPIPYRLGKYVLLLHPGVQVSEPFQKKSKGVASLAIPARSLIERAAVGQLEQASVYIYDTTKRESVFGGAHLVPNETSPGDIQVLSRDDLQAHPLSLQSLRESTKPWRLFEKSIPIEHQTWTILVLASPHTYEPNITYVILGGILIFAACACLALWFRSRMHRVNQVAKIKQLAEQERAALIIENAEKATQKERELNEYLAHEVRNPLAAAMTACHFLSFSHQESIACNDKGSGDVSGGEKTVDRTMIGEDIGIIKTSVEFINDILRSTLDLHKADSKQLKLDESHTDVIKDILEPVKTLLKHRVNSFEVTIEGPKSLIIVVDRLRLKQVVLNLANNAKKFVQKGFIRLRADTTMPGHVLISVEDSGPGIPQSKREKLFSRFQESLDLAHQGTGVGLSLCKSLVGLMNGSIWLDERYESGVEGCLGTRFVVDLPLEPIQIEFDNDGIVGGVCQNGDSTHSCGVVDGEQSPVPLTNGKAKSTSTCGVNDELPKKMSVLMVDDDLMLRKLMMRSLKRIAPKWTVQEAANGETAISLAETQVFDLIFVDQYMASAQKQLLGTETTYALRANGVRCKICGLSANNMEEAFLEAGADCFLQKPLPFKKDILTKELVRIMNR